MRRIRLAGALLAALVVSTPAGAPAVQPEEPRGGRDAGRAPELREAFSAIEGLERVEVTWRGGVVVLSGKVTTPKAKATAAEVARKLPGVLYVEDRIELQEGPTPARPKERSEKDQQIEERLTTIFSRVAELEPIEVSVKAGVVHLTGETPSAEAREQAEELAGKMDGVVFVDNDVEVTHAVGERIEPTFDRFQKRASAIVRDLPLWGIALVIIALAWLLARAVLAVDAPFKLFARQRLVRGIVRQVVASLVFLLGVLVALELLEATALVGAVLGAAGVLGLALGFAFRDIVENYLASVLMGLRRPFSAGDHVVIESHEGKVVRLTTRETILMTLDGNHVRLPNSLVYKSVILNYTRNPLRRFDVLVGVGVEEELMRAQRVGLAALKVTPGVIEDPPPFARVEGLGDSNVAVRFFGWVDQRESDWLKVRSEAVRRVKVELDKAQIELPVPTYRLEGPRPHPRSQPAEAVSEEAVSAHDVEPDDYLDRQVRADEALEEEENLLSNAGR